MNALSVRNGEAFYRATTRGATESWNVRDRHMEQVLDRIFAHGARLGRAVKVVVWSHNTHAGDDRATEPGNAGEINLGMLLRQHHPGDVVLVGTTTYQGT